MIDIGILIALIIIAFRAARALNNNSNIFNEFKLIGYLPLLVFLYPVGPLLIIIAGFLKLIYLYPLAAICYIPQIIIARNNNAKLESAGSDRVNEAKEALSLTILGAIIGLLYLLAIMVLALAVRGLDFSNYGA